MEKLDFKTIEKPLYTGKPGRIDRLVVSEMLFLMIDGQGDPNTSPAYAAAVQALYGMSYGVKFLAKTALGRDHVVGPLEGIWWAEDMEDFRNDRRDRWHWTLMIRQPDWINADMVAMVRAAKGITAPVRLQLLAEGLCLQTLHVGSYAEERPVIARLHAEIAAQGLRPGAPHHEIYLSDPRKVAPDKLKTILRQPVVPV